MVPGKLTASEVVSRKALETAQGGELTVRVEDGTAMVDDAKILKTDIMTSNGVIHVIDSVVLPK